MATINAINNKAGVFTSDTTITATAGAITATAGDITATSGNFLITAATTSTVGQIKQAGNRLLHTYGGDGAGGGFDANLFLGKNAGNFTLTVAANIGGNTGIGTRAMESLVGAQENFGMGYRALGSLTGAVGGTDAYRNVALGNYALYQLTTGNYNIGLGYTGGSLYTSSESSNILMNSQGVAAESHVLRIGNGTGTAEKNLNKAIICGIQGITVTGTAILISSSDQLGIAVSSRRYKDNIQDMADSSDPIMKLRPVTFTLKGEPQAGQQFGLIAEEVYEVMPQLVVLDKEGQPMTVQYHNMPAILLNELQKLKKEVEELKKSLKEQK